MVDIEKLDAYILQLNAEILGPDGTVRLPDVALCAALAHQAKGYLEIAGKYTELAEGLIHELENRYFRLNR